MHFYAVALILLIITISVCLILGNISHDNNFKSKDEKISDCEACKMFVRSFETGMKNTIKGKYDGGDAAWEEEKLSNYASSELRLVEIQEQICSDVKEGKELCFKIHEEFDNEIEEWWFEKQFEYPNLHDYFCINKLKYCCRDFHYGKDCLPCLGYPDEICSSHGICVGNGTSKGTGTCKCDKGYTGKTCNKCAKMYFETHTDDKIVCSPCPKSCKDSCTKFACENCAKGWIKSSADQCLDINECLTSKNICGTGKYCVNTEGSYKCSRCHPACEECTGDGQDMCLSCSKGYKLILNTCVDTTRITEREFIYILRILLLLGFCTTFCVVYEKNGYIAAIMALIFACIFTVTEYVFTIMTHL